MQTHHRCGRISGYVQLGRHSCRIIASVPLSHVHVHSASCAQTSSPRHGNVVTKNRRMETTTIASTVIGKEEDVLAMKEATGSLILDAEAISAKKVLLEAMKSVCCVYNDNICSLHEPHELQGG